MTMARLCVAVFCSLIVSTLQFPAEQLQQEEYKTCTSPPTFISNGHVTISDDGWNAQYSCREDFVLIGPTEVTCVDGSWSPNPPYCLGTGCPLFSAIDHGTMLYQHGGAIAEVRCEEGYTLQGSPVLTCQDHEWNSTMPECVKIGEGDQGQSEVTPDSDDDVTLAARQHASSLAKADYSCITPEQHIPPPIVANAVATPQWSLVDGTARLYATYRCRWHHVLQGSGSNVYCQEGVWVGDLPQCIPLEDKTMDEVRQITIDDISSLSHEQAVELADYSCVDGTKMVDPPHNVNAYVTLQVYISGGLPHLFGEVTCRAGDLVGNKYVYCVQGRWLGSAVKCV